MYIWADGRGTNKSYYLQFMMENGNLVNNMEKLNISYKMEKLDMENGMKEKELSGLMKILQIIQHMDNKSEKN